MKKTIVGMLLVCAAFSKTGYAQCKLDLTNYSMVWNDEFMYADTTALWASGKWYGDTRLHSTDVNFGWETTVFRKNKISMLPLSSHPEGIVRLSGNRLANPVHDANNKAMYFESGILMSKSSIDAKPQSWMYDGFYYGILEIKAKIPMGTLGGWDVYPALWYYSGGTEIDIIDSGRDSSGMMIQSGLIDWTTAPFNYLHNGWALDPAPGPQPPLFQNNHDYFQGERVSYGGVNYIVEPGFIMNQKTSGTYVNQQYWNQKNLSTSFNTFAVAWTPTEVTFFINGRETYTLDASAVPTHVRTGHVIMNLQWFTNTTSTTPAEMDIDYVRLYKPNSGLTYATAPYKSTQEYMYENISNEYASLPNVHTDPGSITTNPNNPAEVFYRGTDNFLYRAEKLSSGSWTIQKINYNYNAPMPAAKIQGDLMYNPVRDIVVYKGFDGRIQFFGKSGNNWYHWFIDDDWSTWQNFISSHPHSMAFNPQGDILYRGWDNKLHKFKWNGSDWVVQPIPHNYLSGELIAGDVIVGSSGNVFYKGANYKIQNFWLSNGGTVYNHGCLDCGGTQHTVRGGPFSMSMAPNDEVYFISWDNRIEKFRYQGGWIHEPINFSGGYNQAVANPLNYSSTPAPIVAPIYDATTGGLVYIGIDGRVQSIKKVGTTWTHRWIDDYWNTDYHVSYSNVFFTGFPSLSVASDGKIIYNQHDGDLSAFEWDDCENLNPPDKTHLAIRSASINLPGTNETTETLDADEFSIFPNPTYDYVYIAGENEIELIRLIDMQGRIVKTAQQATMLLVADLTEGVYTIEISGANFVKRYRLIKK
jgi:hypothetical protein